MMKCIHCGTESAHILEVPGWPTVYKAGYFKKGDIIRCLGNGHLGLVVNPHPGSTFPGDISVMDLCIPWRHASYNCPDGYELVWRDESPGEII
jgi:hypothetical protein